MSKILENGKSLGSGRNGKVVITMFSGRLTARKNFKSKRTRDREFLWMTIYWCNYPESCPEPFGKGKCDGKFVIYMEILEGVTLWELCSGKTNEAKSLSEKVQKDIIRLMNQFNLLRWNSTLETKGEELGILCDLTEFFKGEPTIKAKYDDYNPSNLIINKNGTKLFDFDRVKRKKRRVEKDLYLLFFSAQWSVMSCLDSQPKYIIQDIKRSKLYGNPEMKRVVNRVCLNKGWVSLTESRE